MPKLYLRSLEPRKLHMGEECNHSLHVCCWFHSSKRFLWSANTSFHKRLNRMRIQVHRRLRANVCNFLHIVGNPGNPLHTHSILYWRVSCSTYPVRSIISINHPYNNYYDTFQDVLEYVWQLCTHTRLDRLPQSAIWKANWKIDCLRSTSIVHHYFRRV